MHALIAKRRTISSAYCPFKESFCDIFVIICPGQRKTFRSHTLAAVFGGIVSFFSGGGGIPLWKMPGINTASHPLLLSFLLGIQGFLPWENFEIEIAVGEFWRISSDRMTLHVNK